MKGHATQTKGYRAAAALLGAAALVGAAACNAVSGADAIDFTAMGGGGMASTGSSSDGPVGDPGACPGASVSIDMGEALPPIAGNTMNHTDKFKGASGNYDSSCMNCDCQGVGTYSGPDLIYAVTPSASGTLSITLDATYPSWQLHVRTICDGNTAAAEVACVWGNSPGFTASNPDALSFPVDAGTTYYVAADSWDGSSAGAFTLTISLD